MVVNTFGENYIRLPLYDAINARGLRQRFRREAIPLLNKANSIQVPTGRTPVSGWLLLSRGDYAKLDRYSTALQLEVGNTTQPNNVAMLKNLAIVQAQCVTRGLAASANSIYLVEVTDARGILHNRWFQYPLNAQYNLRSPAYPQTFQLDSMKDYPTAGTGSKTTWTWTTMLQDMWERMPALGTWPGLPYAPLGTPEGFRFVGVPALHTLCDILDTLGMTIACDLTQDAPYTIVDDGADDVVFTALQTKYTTHLEDDQEWIDVGSGRVPSTVKVMFRRRNSVFGTEETVAYRNDVMAQQWQMKTAYTVTVPAPTLFSGATGTHYLWSDFTIRYDDSSNPLDADITAAQQIAQERVTQYFARVYSGTYGQMSQTYAGALPFKTGAMVDMVRWYYGSENDRAGWRTQITRGVEP